VDVGACVESASYDLEMLLGDVVVDARSSRFDVQELPVPEPIETLDETAGSRE
jgi:hypothetical protein